MTMAEDTPVLRAPAAPEHVIVLDRLVQAVRNSYLGDADPDIWEALTQAEDYLDSFDS